jgi:hypothetical protein
MSFRNGKVEPKDYLYQKDESPFQMPYSEWTEKWWNWLVGIPKQTNPANDSSGRFGGTNQPEKDVWYLAGEVKGKAKRKIEIPEGRAILLPVVNFEWSFYEMLGYADKTTLPKLLGFSSGTNKATISPDTLNELKDFTSDFLDDMYSLDAIIDEGEENELRLYTGELCKYRVASDEFDITFPEKNIFGTTDGTTKASSDGYWMFIRKDVFKRGEKHTIWFRGVTQYYQTEVNYEITIV